MPVLATMVVEYVAETSGLGTAVTALAAVGAATVAAGVAAVKMAGDFESGITTLQTGAGESAKNLKMVSDGILAMAPAVGTTTKQLTAGMYEIESSGQHGAQALNTLKMAAEGAKVGNADLGVTANAVTTEMTNYATKGLTAAQATNTLIATVSAGKTHMQDLALAMANVLPIAAKSGISLNDVSAAMATMTAKGIPAADAATYLRQTIMALENPTAKAQAEFKAMGLNSSDVAAEMKTSLPDALAMITDAAGKKFPVGSAQYIAAIANMVGGTKSMQGIMNLTGADMKTFQKNVEDISAKVKDGGNAVLGWSTVQGDFNQKIDQAKATLEVVAIKIGTMLLPVIGNLITALLPVIIAFGNWITSGTALHQIMNILGPIISGVKDAVAYLWPFIVNLWNAIINLVSVVLPLITNSTLLHAIFTILVVVVGILVSVLTFLINIIASVISFFEHNKIAADALVAVLIAIGVVVGVVATVLLIAMIPALIATIAANIALMISMWPLIAIIAVVAAVIFGIILVIQNWGAIMNWCGWLIGTVVHAIGAFFQWLFHFLIGGSIIPDMVNGIISWFNNLLNTIGNIFHNIVSTVQNIWNGFTSWISSAAQNVLNAIKNAWNGMQNMATNAFNSVVTTAQNIFNGLVDWVYSAGGRIVKSIGDGIMAGFHWVTDAIGNVTAWISAHLPFSPAKTGPLVNLQQQGMEISNQIAQGMVNGVPLINSAIGNMTKPISLGLKGVGSAGTPLQGGGSQGDTYVQVILDGKEVTNQVGKRLIKELRGHGLKK